MTEDPGGVSGEDLEALLAEVSVPSVRETAREAGKGSALPVRRTAAQVAAAEKRAAERAEEDALRAAQDAAKARAAQLAQIVNLHIAGFSLADIGASTGHSEDEIERMLANDMARYVRTQPALRTYVRNFISGKYSALLEAVWDEATDKQHEEKLENSAQALRILKEMGRLHGAEAPIQSEVKVESAPEAVERLVSVLAQTQGLGYDVNVFDTVTQIVPGTVVHDAAQQSLAALEAASAAVEEEQPDDTAF